MLIFFNHSMLQLVLMIFRKHHFFLFSFQGRWAGWLAALCVWASLPGSLRSHFILAIIKWMRLCSSNDALRCPLKDGNHHSLHLQILYWIFGTLGAWVFFAVCSVSNPPLPFVGLPSAHSQDEIRWALFAVWSILSPYTFLAYSFFQIRTPMLQLNSCGQTSKSSVITSISTGDSL